MTIPLKMKAIALPSPSGDFTLNEVTVDVPQRVAGQHLIKVEAVGLNPVDAKLARSGVEGWQYPHIMGFDAVGTVVECDDGNPLGPGKRVMIHASLTSQGVLSEYISVPSHALIEIPDSVSNSTAATVPCAGLTAYLSIERLDLKEDQTLLIEGGSGAVGQFAIQMANYLGYRVITTASHDKFAYLRSLGAEHVIDYKAQDIVEQIMAITMNRGVDAVLDTIGGEVTSRCVKVLKFAGSIACLVEYQPIDYKLLFEKAPQLISISLGGAWLSNDMCAQLKMAFIGNKMMNCIGKGDFKVPKVLPVPFEADAISDSLQRQFDGHVFGKQVVMLKQS